MATSTLTLAGIDSMPTNPTPSVFAGRAWQQVLARDPSADGQFVYAVKSTKVYCRPTCPSRRPERKNVTFFPTPALAEAAGFRPCLRCKPQLTSPKPDPQAAAIAKAATFLTQHAGERTKLDDIASAAGLGKFALQRGFKRVLGVTPGDFAREQRKERFRTKVRKPRLSITDAVYEAGFGSPSRLYETVDATLGMSPTAMKAGGAGETIHYAFADSPLGRLLVATTPRGLCAVLFGNSSTDTDADLVADLRDRFPQAVLRPSTAPGTLSSFAEGAGPASSLASASSPPQSPASTLAEALRFVLSRLTETPTAATLPFHVRATAFQQRVWRALLDIPRGETRTYAQIAAAIGSPKSVRAVGTACGSNLLAVVVPCHRVVGSDGRLTGYRWGIDRKRQLLDLERPNLP